MLGRIEHFFGGNNRNDFHAFVVFDLNRPADDDDFVSREGRRIGESFSHSSTGGIGQITNWVEILSRWARGDKDTRHDWGAGPVDS